LKIVLSRVNVNLLINLLNQIFGIGFPVLIQYYTIRHFDLADLGYLNLLNSYWAIFALGLSFFNYYLLKVFASKKAGQDVKLYLTNATVLMYSFIILPFLVFLGFLYFQYSQIFNLTLLTSLPIITAPVSFEIFFQATLRNTFILVRRLIIRVLFIVLMLVFAKDETDFLIYVYIFCLSLTAENLINLAFIRKYISFELIRWSVVKDIAKNSLSYLPFNLTYNLMPNLSIIGASYFVAIDEVTIYSVLVKIVNLATSFITSSVMVLYPVKINSVSNSQNNSFNDGRYLKNTILVSFGAALGLITLHKFIFKAFLENYQVDNMLVQFSILTCFIIFHSVYNYITFSYYFIKNQTFFISIVNVLLLVLYLLSVALVKFNVIPFNFAMMFVLPYPFALSVIYINIMRNKKLNS
jgi:O-antigen/teichoic acid export membrane protein